MKAENSGRSSSSRRWGAPGLATLFTLACTALLPSVGRADSTTCFSFTASPSTYSAPAGGIFTVDTTYTNCGTEGYVSIGSSFGSDGSPFIDTFTGTNFFDPTFFLGPGQSINLPFATYQWEAGAPDGFSQTFNINTFFDFVQAPCDGFIVICVPVDGAPSGFAVTQFDASVAPQVPEPSTLLLVSTGLLAVTRKFRRGKS